MKRGKDEEEDKTRGAMFPRVHVNDTEKGGPRAPPRNKMALFEQLSIPSQTTFNAAPVTNSPFQQSSSTHPIRKPETRQFQHKCRRQEEDFTVPFFDQQSGTSQSHQTSENNHNAKHNNNKFQKQNPQDFAANRQNSFKETNVRDLQAADNTLWGDSLLSKASGYEDNSVPLREVQKESLRDGDAVSENSMLDSISGVDISPDDVVGIIGQKHFWKARRAIVNQQRVFAIQVFELHRLIKVQRLIAGSPHLLVEENTYITKPPTVSPIKKIPIEYIMKSTIDTPKLINELKKPNDDMEFSADNAVGKVSLSSVQNGSQTTNCRPFGGHLLPSDQNMGSWNFDPPPEPGPQWLIPVMSPSEGLVYKPYPAPGFMNLVYGGCGPLGSMPGPGYNVSSYGASPSPHHHHHFYEGSLGVNPFTPLPASHGYFPSYGMQVANTLVSSSTTVEPIKPFNQGSTNFQTEKNGHTVKNNIASKDTEVQASTASSRSDKTKDENALPTSSPAPEPRVVPRVIRVVPHNAQSATASVARIFQSIQEERKKHDSG